ncbi:MAG: hypothetical protein ACI841_004128, partial [Planctomycetota bacterium]
MEIWPEVNADTLDESSGGLIDLGVILVLSCSALMIARAYTQRHQFDGQVDAAFERCRSDAAGKLAIPDGMRSSATRPFRPDERPILFDEQRCSAQGLARLGVSHVLARADNPEDAFAGMVLETHSIGEWLLHRLDIEAAMKQPLRVGRGILWSDSRMYRYRPIGDSLAIEHREPMEFEAVLEAGNYVFLIEAIAPNTGYITVSANVSGSHQVRHALERRVRSPISYEFLLSGDQARRV